MVILDVVPVAKPRMTRQDKWKKRPATTKYWAFCDRLRLEAREKNYIIDEDGPLSLTFYVPMPNSWSIRKRKQMLNRPHKQRPDLDNFIKAYQDAILKEDSVIWWYGEMKKLWAEVGRIIIHEN